MVVSNFTGHVLFNFNRSCVDNTVEKQHEILFDKVSILSIWPLIYSKLRY